MAITSATNEALTPLAESGRVFRWHDHLSLIAGIAHYHGCARWAPQLGAALPALAFTFVLAWFTRRAVAGGPSALVQSRG